MRIGWNGGGHHRSLDSIREQARHAGVQAPTAKEAERTHALLAAFAKESSA